MVVFLLNKISWEVWEFDIESERESPLFISEEVSEVLSFIQLNVHVSKVERLLSLLLYYVETLIAEGNELITGFSAFFYSSEVFIDKRDKHPWRYNLET